MTTPAMAKPRGCFPSAMSERMSPIGLSRPPVQKPTSEQMNPASPRPLVSVLILLTAGAFCW